MKPRLQHKFGNLTLFFPQTCSEQMTSNGLAHSIFYKTTCPLSNDSDQPVQMRRLIRVIALRWLAKQCCIWRYSIKPSLRFSSFCVFLVSKVNPFWLLSKLSLDERWAHMQYCRKCCASAEISESLLAVFIFIKFLATPLSSKDTSSTKTYEYFSYFFTKPWYSESKQLPPL